jgi:hypothetical protein
MSRGHLVRDAGLQAVQEIGGALRMRRGGEERPLIVVQLLIQDAIWDARSPRSSGVRSRSAERNAEPNSATYPDSQAKNKQSE